MGRPPKPTALKRLEGNPGKRPLNENEPQPPIGAGDPPDWLSDAGKEFWREIAPQLEDVGLLTAIDRPVFTLMARVWGQLRAAQARLKEHGRIWAKEETGYSQISGYAADEKALRGEFCTLARSFGMTPGSRSRVVAIPRPGGDTDPLKLV